MRDPVFTTQAGGIKAEAYHAGKADDKRIKVQNNWRSGDTQVRSRTVLYCAMPEPVLHLVLAHPGAHPAQSAGCPQIVSHHQSRPEHLRSAFTRDRSLFPHMTFPPPQIVPAPGPTLTLTQLLHLSFCAR